MRTITQAEFHRMLAHTTRPDPATDAVRLPAGANSTVVAQKDFIFDARHEPAERDYDTGNPPEGGFMLDRMLRSDGTESVLVLADGPLGSEPCGVEGLGTSRIPLRALTPETLLAAGYQKFHDVSAAASLGDWYRASYYRRVHDAVGIRYSITIRHAVMPARGAEPSRDLFTPENQFTGAGTTFNVEMLLGGGTLEAVEAFFERLWTTMRLDYYEGGPDALRHFPQPPAASTM